ncbi:TVG1433995 [Thermoplasma volcanium GSS1]|uniref:TVG1433995 protein n=1 Tax=Thermoplasma volcanium (strain ATCC 51530 / DSM 4299 / JCM 9571 / NBRC 15438 / GSS1) TaxID=273116 RepID=Q978M8_THEVO|nr:hypothetical protein [Thermoplasma volcanium]BAB60529.1 TVG1433995 [Thermoplasma volcanium GSS1]
MAFKWTAKFIAGIISVVFIIIGGYLFGEVISKVIASINRVEFEWGLALLVIGIIILVVIIPKPKLSREKEQ